MINLVITHLTHPWGPPGTLETLGDPWRPCLKMVILAILTISWSINLKIELWAPYTHWQAVLKGEVILRQKAYFGPDYSAQVYKKLQPQISVFIKN